MNPTATSRTNRPPTRHHALLGAMIILPALLCAPPVTAGSATDMVEWVQLDDAECSNEGGKMIAVRGRHSAGTLKIWLDRWYSGIKTGDRGHHELAVGEEPLQLGCSKTGGEDQRWELVDAEVLTK
jgi:hypothetical protein